MEQKMNPAFKNIVLSQIVEISEKVRKYSKEFEKIHKKPFIQFQRGDMGIDTPEYIKEAVMEGLEKGLTRYPKSGGEPWFREAVVNHLEEIGINNIGKENVMATYGGQEGLQLVFSLFSGSRCVTFSPCWSCMLDNIFPYAGINYKLIPLKQNFEIDFDEFENALKNADIIYLNNPHNPTGKVFTHDELDRINRLCKKYGVIVVSDEAYKDIVFKDNKFHSMLEFDSDNVVSVFTFSKSFAATGFRAGYTVSRNNFIIEKMVLGDYSQTAGVVTFVQYAFKIALENKEKRNEWLKWFQAELEHRSEVAYQELSKFIENVYKPGGTFYFFIDLRKFLEKNVEDMDKYLMDIFLKKGVSLTPGSAFGDDFKGFVRLSLSALNEDMIKEGISRIRSALELDNK